MLPDTINPTASLLDSAQPQVNLGRWMHQCELIKSYYHGTCAFIIQRIALGFEVTVSSTNEHPIFSAGATYPADFILFKQVVNSPVEGRNQNLASFMLDELPREFDGIQHILSRPIYWPDGSVFGGLCVINPHLPQNAQHEAMLEPFQILLQQDLTLLCQNSRIDSLSMRDQETGLLNRYGFLLMAPRQLNLSRRFGAHAGIIFFELTPNTTQKTPPIASSSINEPPAEKHHRWLANLLQNTIRTADIAAHYHDTQFVVLAFIDNERDILQIIKRTEKLLEQHNQYLKLDIGYSFFSPSANVKLPEMIDAARNNLTSQQPTTHQPTQGNILKSVSYDNSPPHSTALV